MEFCETKNNPVLYAIRSYFAQPTVLFAKQDLLSGKKPIVTKCNKVLKISKMLFVKMKHRGFRSVKLSFLQMFFKFFTNLFLTELRDLFKFFETRIKITKRSSDFECFVFNHFPKFDY